MSKIEEFLFKLSSATQRVLIYGENHPQAKEAVNQVYSLLKEIVEQGPLIIGLIDGEFASGKDIYFSLSNKLKDFIANLETKKIKKMVFSPMVSQSELLDFIICLNQKKEVTGDDFISYYQQKGIENIQIGNLTINNAELKQLEKVNSEKVQSFNRLLLNKDEKSKLIGISQVIHDLVQQKHIDADASKNILASSLEAVLVGDWSFLSITSLYNYDLNTYLHCLNVGVLSMFLAFCWGFTKEDILKIGMAGLFHDIGKIAISPYIIKKKQTLTDQEMKTVQSHAIKGAEILLNYTDSLGELPYLVAFEHHLRYDGKGYPKLLIPYKPHFISLLVSICDCYDALRSRRSYKRDYSPEFIYELMSKERGKMFDPKLFDLFFKSIGVYPVGTIVELTTKAIGVVRSQNYENIYSPVVEILFPAEQKGEVINLVDCPNVQIKASLNPLTKGKDFLDYI